MDLPDESLWDETTCNLAACQHPQCWAAIRRIERGHPRILASPCKTPLDVNNKLPELTIINLPDSCFKAKRCPNRCLPGLSITKPRSLLSQGSKSHSKFQGRPCNDLPDKDWISSTNKSPKASHRWKKLPVLNLNETQLPCPQDVGNMVVIWIPKESEEYVGPAEQYTARSQGRRKRRKTPAGKDRSSLVLPGKEDIETQLRTSGINVPPSSPVHWFEPLSPELLPTWNQPDSLPPDLLNELLSDEGKTTPCLEMKTQLAMMKKKPPLEKSRPDSAISAQMFLSVHRLTLQRPTLRYPAHLRKLYYSLKTEGHGRQPQQQRQQQRKLKMPARKQETKKKPRSDPGNQSTSGHRTQPGQESDKKQQQMKNNGPTLKQDSTERPQMDYAENYLDSSPSEQNPKLSKTEPTNKNISTQMEVVPQAQERTPNDLSASTSSTSWNPELKLLRILQSTDYEDESHLSGPQREEPLEA